MTWRELAKQGAETLKKAGIGEYETDALELILAFKNWSRTAYLLEREGEASSEEEAALKEQFRIRASRVPLQHITGEAWFYGRRFAVTPEVLIPRLDTETLVSEVLKEAKDPALSVLDLCTGSGCIAVTLKLEGGYRTVSASDVSPAALRTAQKNAEQLCAEICFYESDLFSRIPGQFDLIVSNPPYIAETELSALAPEVKDHDPKLALIGGRDGLDFYRRIAAECPASLKKGGRIFLEIGADQGPQVQSILADAGFGSIRIIKDLAGLDRVVSGILL